MLWPPTLKYLLVEYGQVSHSLMTRRVPKLLAALGPRLPVVVKIAGTNGKGSTAAMLAAILIKQGYSVGLFTSPHLVRVGERFRVNGEILANEILDGHAVTLKADLDVFLEQHGTDFRPSFFEILLLLALRCFASHQVDIAILEAGVGGYRDALQFCEGLVSAITSVGLDHCDKLGGSLEAIARDKAGIASADSHLLVSRTIEPWLRQVIAAENEKRGVKVLVSAPLKASLTDLGIDGWKLQDANGSAVHCPLAGSHQVANMELAVGLVNLLKELNQISQNDLCGLAETQWPGRLQRLSNGWIVDVAHNPPALHMLATFLETHREHLAPIRLVYGVAADKDLRQCLPLLPRSQELYCVGGFYRSMAVEDLASQVNASVKGCFSNPAEACEVLGKRPFRGTTLVTGSVFLVGAVMACFDENAGDSSVKV